MHCSNCGAVIADGQRFCSSCGASLSGETGAGSPAVVVEKQELGLAQKCVKDIGRALSYAFNFKGFVGKLKFCVWVGLGLMIFGLYQDYKREAEIEASAAVTNEEAVKNGKELIEWMMERSKLTSIVRDEWFENLKGKTVMLRGKVLDVDTTKDHGEEVGCVSLKLDEGPEVKFVLQPNEAAKIRKWNRGEVHTLRGRIEKSNSDWYGGVTCNIAVAVE